MIIIIIIVLKSIKLFCNRSAACILGLAAGQLVK